MYIKIKHIKNTLLISACLFFIGFNYLTYAKADNAKDSATKSCDKSIDADCDGLTDAEEKLYGTDPKNIDTDGDSYSDGVEVESGFDPTKPAPGDKLVTSSSPAATQSSLTEASTTSLTTELVQEIQGYTDSKGGESISATDLQSFMNTSLDKKLGSPLTWDTFSNIDQTKIKILDQTYPSLSAAAKKAKIRQDAYAYTTKIGYLIDSNLPNTISSYDDYILFGDNFKNELYSLSTATPDTKYFSDLGDRLELFSKQINEVEVPQTALNIHLKFLSLINAALSLREFTSSPQDPMTTVVLFSKIQNVIDLTTDFLENDYQEYFNQL
jgi:hypothetical protein